MRKAVFSRAAALFLMVLGLSLFLFGIVRGEPLSVFQKAVFVCLECVGIG